MLTTDIKQLIENKWGKPIRYPKDCEDLAADMRAKHNLVLSGSTLKRLMGFYKETEMPRLYTLDTIARFLGFETWESLANSLEINADNSQIGKIESLAAEDLQAEDFVIIGYTPQRKLLLRFLGDFKFEVLESTGSKIKTNDILKIFHIVCRYPLMCHDVSRNGTSVGKYIGGKNGGVSYIYKVNKPDQHHP